MPITKVKERQNKILNYLKAQNEATYAELSEKLDVHSMTIRRDIQILEEQGLLIRTPKGAHIISKEFLTYSTDLEMKENEDQKRKIADYIVHNIIEENDSIFLGPGTLNLLIAEELFLNEATLFKNLVIYTNAYDILSYEFSHYRNKYQVIVAGGHLDPVASCFYGEHTLNTINSWKVDKLFVEANAIMVEHGKALINNNIESSVIPKILSIAPKRYLIADSTVFEKRAVYPLADLEEITLIITGKLKENIASILKSGNIEFVEL
jgi:DeoR family transcriptional regulator, lactose phosphotransferase system repressor